MIRITKRPLDIYLCAIIMLFNIMPFVSRFISTFLTTYFYLLVLVLVFFSLLNKCGNKWIHRMLPLILVVLLDNLPSLFEGGSILTVGYTMLNMLCIISISVYYLDLDEYNKRFLRKVVFAGIVVTLLTTMFFCITESASVRFGTSLKDSNDPLFVEYNWKNIGGFSFVYMLVSIYPAIIGYMKTSGVRLWKQVAVFATLLVFFITAQFTIALLLFCAFSVLWFLPTNMSPGQLVAIVFILIIAILVFKNPLANLLIDLGASSSSSVLSERLQYLGHNLIGQTIDSDVGRRFEVYASDIARILQSPILGNWYQSVQHTSGHSFLLGIIAKFGIIGWMLIIWTYAVIRRYLFNKKIAYGYSVAAMCAAIAASLLNTGDHWLELCLYVPMMFDALRESQVASYE